MASKRDTLQLAMMQATLWYALGHSDRALVDVNRLCLFKRQQAGEGAGQLLSNRKHQTQWVRVQGNR